MSPLIRFIQLVLALSILTVPNLRGQGVPPGFPEITTAPSGGTREAGVSSTLTVVASGNATLTYQWFRGTASTPIADIAGATSASYTIANPTTTHTSYYGVRVTNSLGSASSVPVLVTYEKRAGSLASNSAAGNLINALLPLPDGSMICGGAFLTLTPAAGVISNAYRLARILSNNTVESTATFPFVNGNVGALHRDSSGRIIVAGDSNGFIYVYNNSVPTERKRLARFLANGTLDTAFLSPFTSSGQIIHAIESDANGRVYLGGQFSATGGLPGSGQYLARLDATTGAVDPSFIPEAGILTVRALHLRADGKLLVAHNGAGGLWLLNSDGSRDTSFFSNNFIFGPSGALALLPLANGDVIVAANSTLYKLDSTGTIVAGFPAAPINFGNSSSIRLLPLPNSDICISGDFNTYNSASAGYIHFVNADGSDDTTYNIGNGFNQPVLATAVDTQGLLHIGGNFTTYRGATSTRYAILNTTTTTPPDPGAPVLTNPFTDFLTNANIPINLRGPNDDPDNDSLDNLLEYALDLNPNGSGGSSYTGTMPAMAKTPSLLQYTYRRVRNDVTYVVQTSPNLSGGTWTSVGVAQGTPDGNGTTTASIPVTPGSQFLRLYVTR